MRTLLRLLMTCVSSAAFLAATMAHGAAIDFSGVNPAFVTSSAGQDFAYQIGTGGPVGIVNVRLISGDYYSIQPGHSPDPTGFYLLQTGSIGTVVIRFTFDREQRFLVSSNETLTDFERNRFVVPSFAHPWALVGASLCTVSNVGQTIEFLGTSAPPYGQFQIANIGTTFDYVIVNMPGISLYGSGISVDMMSAVTATRQASWGTLKARFR